MLAVSQNLVAVGNTRVAVTELTVRERESWDSRRRQSTAVLGKAAGVLLRRGRAPELPGG